jgi:virulence-associated protein E/DNA primase RepB-like protein
MHADPNTPEQHADARAYADAHWAEHYADELVEPTIPDLDGVRYGMRPLDGRVGVPSVLHEKIGSRWVPYEAGGSPATLEEARAAFDDLSQVTEPETAPEAAAAPAADELVERAEGAATDAAPAEPTAEDMTDVVAQIRKQLSAIFDDVPGRIRLWTSNVSTGAIQIDLARNVGEAVVLARRRSGLLDTNVYVQMATTRARARKGSGEKANLRAVQCVWVDVDDCDPEAKLEELDRMGLRRPSLAWASGPRGLHAIWLLDAPVDLTVPEGVAWVESVLRGLVQRTGADPARTNANSVLRVVGTTNYPNEAKRAKGRTESPVRLLRCQRARRYSRADFEELRALGAERGTSAPADYERRAVTEDEWDSFEGLLDGNEDLHAAFERQTTGDFNGDDSRVDQSLANLLAIRDVAPHVIEEALKRSRDEHGAEKGSDEKGDHYWPLTVGKALDWAREQRAQSFDAFDDVETLPAALTEQRQALVDMKAAQSREVLLERKKNGTPEKTYGNTLAATRAAKFEPALNDLTDMVELRAKELPFTHPIGRVVTDDVARVIREWLILQYRLDVTLEHVFEALRTVGIERRFNPLVEHLDSRVWDGTPRIDGWLVDYAGVADTPYARAVGRLMLLGAVARAFVPGIKFDTMLILEGPQGGYKSTLIRVLGGEWTAEGMPPLSDKDAVCHVQGKWLLEFDELVAMRKAARETLKSFLSKTEDRMRKPYGKGSADYPRRCAFIGTTNDSSYLHDATGGRRFWPVKVGAIRIEAVQRDRDQLWAEAVAVWKADPRPEALVLPRHLWASAEAEQEQRREADPWEDTAPEIAHGLAGDPPGRVVRASEILAGLLKGREPEQRDVGRLRRVLEPLGWAYGKLWCSTECATVRGFRRT